MSRQIGAEAKVAEARRARPGMDDLVQSQTVATSVASVVMEHQRAPAPALLPSGWMTIGAVDCRKPHAGGSPGRPVRRHDGRRHLSRRGRERNPARTAKPRLKGSELLRNRLRKRN